MKLLSSKRTALTVAVAILALVFLPAVISVGSASIQAAHLVDELPAPAFGSPASADLDSHYATLLGAAMIAVMALIATVTLIVIALNTRPMRHFRNADNNYYGK